MEDDELLDLVDEHNNVVGTVMRESYHANCAQYVEQGQYWRGTACFLLNTSNEIWVPRRQPWRKVAPGGLDFSMAEHVKSGETHLEGSVRGMAEELNLIVQPDALVEVIQFLAEEIGCIMRIYLYRTNNDPDYSRDDYQSARWLSVLELRHELETPGKKFKSMMPEGLTGLEKLLAKS